MTGSHNRLDERRTLRAAMSVAAALCVLGLASLVFVHSPDAGFAAADAASVAVDSGTTLGPGAPLAGWTNVPSAESVFRDKGYVAPEEPIAQF
jgi:hypothetical protein